ncbi:hypothetical protein SLE2022_053370 [Rubroshorea leprosula]
MSIKTKMSVTNWSIKNEISIDNMSINKVRIKNIMDIESGVPTQSIYVSWFNGNNCFLEWKNGGISGSGSLYRADGNGCSVLCVGEWENGFISGRGELSRADGNGCKVACVGNWENGGLSGRGELNWADGNGWKVPCVEEWEDGGISGRGVLYRADENSCKVLCVGERENGKISGRGALRRADGNGCKVLCIGEWENGGISGRGALNWADGNGYKVRCLGEWENGGISGRGVLHFSDGNGCGPRIIGDWENVMISGPKGHGVFSWPDGNGVIAPSGRFKRNITCWEKVKLLGCGSFGSVYEGISGDGTFFALKEVSLLDQGSRGEKSIAHLEQEIRLLSQLKHKNIVWCYGTEKVTKLNDVKSFQGTAFWMAPEVINPKNQGYGLSADIWSLGCTVLEMLTRKVPYSPLESQQALFKICNGEPPPVPDSLSNDARDFILQCLQVNPNSRPTAAQLLDHSFVRSSLSTS